MKDDRFQYQPWYVKLWRYRYYIPIPFRVLWSKLHSNESWNLLWSIHIGLAQGKMKWYYTMDEVFGSENDLG